MKNVFTGMALSAVAATLMTGGLAAAWAQDAAPEAPATEAPAADAPAAETPAADAPKPTGFWERDRLTGDWGGVRDDLEDAGIKLGGNEISDGLMNVSGGKSRGATYQGQTELDLDLDLDKLVGWTGATVHISALQVHGRSLTTNKTDALLTSSSIDSDRGTRLLDLYLDQPLFEGAASLRIGQAGADEEFMISKVATPFVNAAFGFPGLPSVDLPSAGPESPFATPMARLKLTPTDQWTVLIGAFNGDPTGGGFSPKDPAPLDPSGTSFRTDGGLLGLVEAQYAVNQDKDAQGLPATYKLGLWAQSSRFPNQHIDPTTEKLNGDFSVYAIADQMLWRRPDTQDEGISIFARIMGAPDDRNLISLYADGGVAFKGPFEGRSDDIAGLAIGYSKISDSTRAYDETRQLTEPGRPIRDYEIDMEATYQVAVTPWWQLQPDLQYIVHPGGNIAASERFPQGALGNALVAGVRTTITF